MLKNFFCKQKSLLAFLACSRARQECPSPAYVQNAHGTSSPSDLTYFLLPQPEKSLNAADWPMQRLISNLPDTICRIMHNSEKGSRDYLRYIADLDLVFILDNSGSMMMKTDDNSYLNALNLFGEVLPVSRHHEMSFVFLSMIHVLVNCGKRCIEVRLLNPVHISGRSIRTLHVDLGNPISIQYLYSVLLRRPCGTTPLVSNLHESVSKVTRPTHYIVFTDGCPYVSESNNCEYADTVSGLQKLLRDHFCPRGVSDFIFGRRSLTINFVACTDNKDDVAYLDTLDRMSESIDVTDDLHTEIRQVIDARGKSVAMEIFPSTVSAFIYKAMVGCLDRAADHQDEIA